MGRKNKYLNELKSSIVKRYLEGEGSTISLAKEINTSGNIVGNWVKNIMHLVKVHLIFLIQMHFGYEVGDHNNNILVFNTFDKAVKDNPNARPLFHSGRGF